MNDIVKLNEIIVWCLNSEYLLVERGFLKIIMFLLFLHQEWLG